MIKITEDKTEKLPGITSLYLEFQYNQEIIDIIKSLPVYNYNKNNHKWEVPINYLSRLLDRLYTYDEIELNILPDEEKQLEKEIVLPEYKIPLFEHQKDAIRYCLNGHNKFLLLDEPGLGKTASIIHIAEELKKKENIEHCLIVCGVNTLKTNWKKEIQKHSNLSCRILGEKISKTGKIVYGTVAERIEELKHPIDEFFLITNIESLRNEDLVKALNNKKINNFDMVALDEAHHCKTPTASQTKGLMKLDANYKIAATGTVLTNSPLDAYTVLKWIGMENGTYTNFKYFYCNYTGPFHNILLGYKNLDVLKNQLELCSLRRTKDLLNLPEKNVIEEYVEMDNDQAEFYENIKNGIVEEADKVELKPAALLSMVTRLRQVTSCPSILTTNNVSSAKIDRTCDLVEQLINNNEKVVIFSVFKETLEVLKEKLKEYHPLICTGDIKDSIISENIDKFQRDDESKIILATSQKLGTGVTLTRASYAIFIDTPWTDADFVQAQDRIHRIGAKKPVFIYNLITTNTIDERVRDIVNSKKAIADFVVDDKIDVNFANMLKSIIEDLK